MCGFIGSVSKRTLCKEDLLRGLAWIRRRGPDSQDTWLSGDARVGILHARLAIVDKDPRARQPFSDKDAGTTLAFIGEVYNHKEVRNTFPDYRFSTHSDTEVILAAYATHGVTGLSLCKGPFSIAIVDERRKKIILARDPIGKKPLYYARWGGELFFGTSLLPLAALHKNDISIDENTLAYFWEHAHLHPKTSVFSGARPVLPGEVLEFDWSGNLAAQSSCRAKPLCTYEGEPLDEVIDKVRWLLTTAVSRRLDNNPDPVVFLSGGIDSTVICSLVNEACKKKESAPTPRVLTLAPLIPLINDEIYGMYAAHQIGVKLERVNIAAKVTRLADLIIQAFDLQDEPLGMPSYFLLARLVNAISSYGRVIISGDGGDEIFLGYGKPGDWHCQKTSEAFDETHISCGPEVPGWMSAWGREAVSDWLVGHVFAMGDRATAEQGVESRAPILDWDVVSYVRGLPFEFLTHGDRTKALLKDQLRGWPRWFLERHKLGFCYNLRWLWRVTGYAGMRENIDRRTTDMFEHLLPEPFKGEALQWSTSAIFKDFSAAWRLLAWSAFLKRLDKARTG
jgi:asparagine synthase (glutamine-hydrolysing)